MPKKPETLKIVRTKGGYAVFLSPSAHPLAVFSSGHELLDWVARQIATWETHRPQVRGSRRTPSEEGPPSGGTAGTSSVD